MGQSVISAIDVARRVEAPTLRAVDYLRVSTEEQKKGYGIAYTGKKTSKYILGKGWKHVGTYSDEGVSGALEAHEREDLSRLMEDARQTPRPFDIVIVHEGRAIGRTGRAFWLWVWELKKLGIYVGVAKKDYDNSTPEGESKMRKDADYAEDERNIIRERTQGGLQEKAEDGGYTGGNVAYGYRVLNKGVKGESRLIVDECNCGDGCVIKHEADCLRRARTLYVQKRNWNDVALALNAEGYRRRDGALWGRGGIRQQVLNPVVLEARQIYRGSAHVKRDRAGAPINGDSVVISLPEIFTSEEIKELKSAQRVLSRTSSLGNVYPLSGRIPSDCGALYVGGGHEGRQRVYRCKGKEGKVAGASVCSCGYIHAEPVEKETWNLLREFLGDVEQLKAMADDWLGVGSGQRVNFDDHIKELDQQIKVQTRALNMTRAVTAKELAGQEELSEAEAEEELEKAVAPLQLELANLRKKKKDVEDWKAEAESAHDRTSKLLQLAEMAHKRLGKPSAQMQADFMSMLDVKVTVLYAPAPPKGKSCTLAEWFRKNKREVPTITDSGWAKVEGLLASKGRKHSPRLLLESILHKARTGTPWQDLPSSFPPFQTLATTWTRWRDSGLWEQVMDALAGEEGAPVPAEPAAKIRLECSIVPDLILESEGRLGELAPRGWQHQATFKFQAVLTS
ncbi:recombinase family protein [Streptomyces sp. UNOC14_S4]|uniref:recombinase family protein n=1 Tax=Streptomyces sp. UNOC14_S4 TaxID=2872340 RepID=UPI001E2C9EFE|nr:recombinase family protein [Streptomyces sp. UNOC14_S4]MCC3765986.1 recombinase family protein [Streptomyces sp. UNOC14_S4]